MSTWPANGSEGRLRDQLAMLAEHGEGVQVILLPPGDPTAE